MGTIAQKVQWTWDCKRDIEQALLERGIALPQDFRDFGDAIRSIGRKPYDSEVEYLESTGTQYIDTGVNADGSVLSVEIDVDCSAAGQFAGAIRQDSSSEWTRMHFGVASGYDTIYIGSSPTNGSTWFRTSQISGRRVFRYDAQNKTGAIGTYTAALVPVSPTDTTISFWLFGRHGLNMADALSSAKIYAAKLWQSGVLVRDFIPVRKNGVGYLYDKVSGKLFGNAGTGAFLYGDDVREVEYLESTGTQYIDTGISMASNSAVPLKVSVDSYGVVNCGIVHNNVAAGTWLGFARPIDLSDFRIYKDNYNTKIIKSYSDARHIHVWDGSSGFYENGVLVESFTAGVGTDNITGIPWYLGRMYDFYTSSPQTSNTKAYKIYSAQMWVNGVLVRDFIPYRIGNKGCLYDRVSGKFFTNAGTGDFTAGPDALNPTITSKAVYDAKVEYIESTGTQFIDTGIVPDGKGTSVECVFSNSVDGNFTPVLWTRGTNATDRAYCFELEQHQQARWDYADYGPVQVANAFPLNEKVTLTIKDGTATVNGVQMTRASKAFTGAGPMILCNFCNYINGERQMLSVNANPVRIYSFKIFSDGLLVRDFIPVRKDGRGCLCDLVTGRLFENAGTGVFKYGADVVDLPEDTEMIYDSEVEYLESTGTQYIDTGFTATGYTTAQGEFSNINYPATGSEVIFGSREDAGGYKLFSANAYSNMIQFYYSGASTLAFIRTTPNRAVIRLAPDEVAVNSQTSQITSTKTDYVRPIYIFRRSCPDGINPLQCSGGRLHSFQIWDSGVLVRDFQPVRKNGVGYLFDKVGRKLYGNAGTGAFTYGGDK